MAFVYAMVDLRSNIPFYVGITGNPKVRLNQHRCYMLSKEEKNHCSMVLIEEIRSRFDFETESEWIEYFKFMGCNLRNKTRHSNTTRGLKLVCSEFEEDHIALIKKEAKSDGVSMSEILRRALNRYFKEGK